ncbi:PREDICTED: L-seryl-tRNA(Sec) kinase-like [Amphimedon queenslandica]|uniref:L-seryl-tRNA(Sec) kinase n=1 Tax=Amphimedon queenslandica TaxID=400682 RepID=A0AAN0ITM7_AMPQE|nr:PREDICTED: L-seryl-tRNA(Sec) kinase-like [Amphimedon queenslandica]|eukprot:XP_011409618.1 PREDICTED: L-seryl-tRNA(Sec) kinase-like [Amphimedon queenslandica]
MASSNQPSRSSHTCILLLFGIPGSGKTTLSRELVLRKSSQEHSDQHRETKSTQFDIVHICMDDYYPTDEREGSEKNSDEFINDDFDWKQYRHIVTENIDEYLSGKSNVMFSTGGEIKVEGEKNEVIKLLIIDDNLHLRSMRKEFVQIARKYTCGFALVYLSCQLDSAIKRNSTRPFPVPHQTIVNIYQRIEPPQENWERHAITIDSTNNDKEWIETACSRILKLCQDAIEDPQMPQLDLTAERAESQRITSESLMHQADQILRQFVSNEIKSIQELADKRIIKETALKANETRKLLLHELQQDKQMQLTSNEELKLFLKLKYDEIFKK